MGQMLYFSGETPHGHRVQCAAREDTTDLLVLASSLVVPNDEYRLGRYWPLTGWAADIGAHIGAVTLTLLADNPDLRVIAVEPIPENVAVLRESLRLNEGFTERCTVIEGGIGSGPVHVHYGSDEADGFAYQNRYIGNQNDVLPHPWVQTASSEGIHFGDIVKMAGGALDFVKWDCEGCEWWHGLVDNPEACRIIVGEWHGVALPGGGPGKEGIRAILEPTHDVELGPTDGIGSFFAVRR